MEGRTIVSQLWLFILIIDHRFYKRTSINRCSFNIPNEVVCDCGKGIEDVLHHFLCQCSVYCNLRKVLDDTILEVWNETGIEHCLDITVQLILAPFTDSRLSFQQCKWILSATFDFIKNSARCL